MKTRKYISAIALAVVAMLSVACEKETTEPQDDKNTVVSLVGTKWARHWVEEVVLPQFGLPKCDIYDTLYFVNEDEYIFVQHTVYEGVDYEGVRGHQSTYYFDGIRNGYLQWENEQGDTVKFTYLSDKISCKTHHYYRVQE